MSHIVSIGLDDDVYEWLEGERGAVARSRYVNDLLRSLVEDRGRLGGEVVESSVRPVDFDIKSPDELREGMELRQRVLKKLEVMLDEGYQADRDDEVELASMLGELGWSFDAMNRRLWDNTGEKAKLVKEF